MKLLEGLLNKKMHLKSALPIRSLGRGVGDPRPKALASSAAFSVIRGSVYPFGLINS